MRNWLARVNLLHAFSQNNIATAGETPTDGYNLLKAELAYTTPLQPNDFGARFLTVGVAGNNLLNDDIRNQRVVQEGRGADAGPRRAVLRDAEELMQAW